MRTIGVGVEGPSDSRFWVKTLHRCFGAGAVRFKVQNMSNRHGLIQKAGRLLGMFRGLHYAAGILILDQDKDPCVTDLRNLFDEAVRTELTKPLAERYLHLCVARREIESWYLADSDAITAILPSAQYDLPKDTSVWGKGKLRELCKSAGIGYNELAFAEQIAPKFNAQRARPYSESLRVAWERIENAVTRGLKEHSGE